MLTGFVTGGVVRTGPQKTLHLGWRTAYTADETELQAMLALHFLKNK